MADPRAPSARELEIIFVAFQCLKDTPQIDYEKLASTGIYKNAHSASSNWSTLRKKIFRADGIPVLASGGTGTGSTEPRTPRKNASAVAAGPSTPKTNNGKGRGKSKAGKKGKEGLSAETVGKGDSDSDGAVWEGEGKVGVKREREEDREKEEESGEQEYKKKAMRGGQTVKKVKVQGVEEGEGAGAEEDGHDGEC